MPLYTVINIILIFLEEEAHEGSLHSTAAGSVGGRRAQGGESKGKVWRAGRARLLGRVRMRDFIYLRAMGEGLSGRLK